MTEAMVLPELTARPIPGTDPDLVAALALARLPADDLAEPGRNFLAFATAEGRACGFGGYEILGSHALIRSMVVLEAERGRGIGAAMLARLQSEAQAAGARDAWLLTKTAAPFFSRRGYRAAARYEAPPEILASRQATALCPVTTQIMTRNLPG